jgi:hypothetical protein
MDNLTSFADRTARTPFGVLGVFEFNVDLAQSSFEPTHLCDTGLESVGGCEDNRNGSRIRHSWMIRARSQFLD